MDVLATVAAARNAAGGEAQPKEGSANDNAANDKVSARTNAGQGRGSGTNGAPIDGALLAMDPDALQAIVDLIRNQQTQRAQPPVATP